jgi:hypothetical protein
MIKLNILTQLNDKGLKQAEKGFAGLAKSTLLSSAALLTVGRYLVSAVKAAAADEKGQALLATQIRATTGATNAQVAEIEKFIARTQDAAAVADDELRPALSSLVRATKDTERAQKLLGLALDISAGSGKSLESVSLALGRAANGNVTALTRLGVPLDANAVKTKDFDAITKDLARTFAGQASASADSFEGKARKLQLALDDIKEEIGRFLIPLLGEFVDALIPAARALRYLADQADQTGFSLAGTRFSLQNFVSVLAKRVLFGPVLGQFVQLGMRTKDLGEEFERTRVSSRLSSDMLKKLGSDLPVKELLNFKFLTDENGKSTKKAKDETENYAKTLKGKLADALKTAGDQVIEAEKQFKDFSKSISQTFTKDLTFSTAEEAGQETGQGYIDGLVSQAAKIKTFGELTNRLIAAGISQDALQTVLGAGVDAGTKIAQTLIDGGVNTITGPGGINEVVASVQSMADLVGTNAANSWYKSGVDNAKAYVTGLKAVIDGIDLTKIKTKKQLRQAMKSLTAALEVPALAEGGITTGPTLALIGDNPGGREAVIPLNRMNEFGGGTTVTINVSGGDPQAVVDALRRYMQINGTVPIRVS